MQSAVRTAGAADGQQPSLTILGAGNCLDLDLSRITAGFREIHLVDIDREAVAEAVAELAAGLGVSENVFQIHAPLDIAEPLLSREAADVQAQETTESLPKELMSFLTSLGSDRIPGGLPATDLVVSTCLLSQLVEALSSIVGPQIPQYAMALQALRIGHAKRMLRLCRPGGAVILITDLVSSDTAPELAEVATADLSEIVKRCLQKGNFFSGCNPELVLRDFQILAHATGRVARTLIHAPWLWAVGPRVYAVYAVESLLNGGTAGGPATESAGHEPQPASGSENRAAVNSDED